MSCNLSSYWTSYSSLHAPVNHCTWRFDLKNCSESSFVYPLQFFFYHWCGKSATPSYSMSDVVGFSKGSYNEGERNKLFVCVAICYRLNGWLKLWYLELCDHLVNVWLCEGYPQLSDIYIFLNERETRFQEAKRIYANWDPGQSMAKWKPHCRWNCSRTIMCSQTQHICSFFPMNSKVGSF